MLFIVDEEKKLLSDVDSTWSPKELELEAYLTNNTDEGVTKLSYSVFGEDLLLIKTQVRTRQKKRADILALDRAGNGVVIELKRHVGKLGVETQALQYLADFSAYKGRNFIRKFSGINGLDEESILGFIGDNAEEDEINRRSRIILIAQDFDETVYSMGEWLSSKGVGFRCIRYLPVEIAGKKLLTFSVAFDRTPESLYHVQSSSSIREPGIFWHNIARPEQGWWQYLVDAGEIPACFQNKRGDQGEALLTRYIAGDRVVAYAKGYGAIGWGVIEDPESYSLIDAGSSGDKLEGNCRHRLKIKWKAVAPMLSDGIRADEVRNQFGIYHPISTSVSINRSHGTKLIEALNQRFP